MEVLNHTFVNPFDEDLDKNESYNLASGRPVSQEAAKCLLSYETLGQEMMKEFKTRILGSHEAEKMLFDPIKQTKWIGFSSNAVKATLKVNGKLKDIAAQRDILGLLVANSHTGKISVNLDDALTYPLAPLASTDGFRRKTNKSKFYDVLDPVLSDTVYVPSPVGSKQYFIYDLAAALRAIT